MTTASTMQQPFMQPTFIPQPLTITTRVNRDLNINHGTINHGTISHTHEHLNVSDAVAENNVSDQGQGGACIQEGDIVREAEVQERDGNGDDVVSENIDVSENNVSGQGKGGARIQEGDIVREAEVQERDGNGDDVVSENIDVSANNNIQERGEWSCSRCTLRNRRDSLSCDCGTPRFPNRVPGVNFFDLTRAVDADSSLNPRYRQGNVRERPLTPILLD